MLEPLWVGVHHVHAASMPELGPYVSDAETWAERRPFHVELFEKPDPTLFLARLGEALVGYALLHVEPVGETFIADTWRTGERIGELESIAVAPEHRGEGIGSALLDAVDREFDALGVADVIVGALPGNVDAIRLYERRGFRPTWMYLSRLRGGDACGRAAVARGVRGAYSIIEGKEPAALGALAVGPGALALAEGTLVGFVAHMATNPTSVRVRGASPLVACARRPPSEQQRERTSQRGDHRHPPSSMML